MLNTFIEKLRRTSVQDANEAASLLASCSLPDPDDLRRQLAAFESQLAADDAAWERLDRTSNPRAFMEQQAIAERRERLLMAHLAHGGISTMPVDARVLPELQPSHGLLAPVCFRP